MSREGEERLIGLAQALRERDEAALDGATLSRLTAARNRALSELEPSRRKQHRWQVAASLAASIAVAAVVVVTLHGTERTPGLELAVVDELELLASDDLELVEELEFYQWLEAEGLRG